MRTSEDVRDKWWQVWGMCNGEVEKVAKQVKTDENKIVYHLKWQETFWKQPQNNWHIHQITYFVQVFFNKNYKQTHS